MAKSKESPAALAERVRQALLTVAEADGDVPLVGRADASPMFVGTAAATRPVVELLRQTDPPWVTFHRVGRAEHVRLTAAGFTEALPSLPAERVAAVAKRVAGSLAIGERVAFFDAVVRRVPEAAVELVAEQRAAVDAEKADAEARLAASAKRRELEEATRKTLREWEALQDERRRLRIDTLRRELEIEGAKVELAAGVSPAPSPKPEPRPPVTRLRAETKEDMTFRRQMARRLVSSWLEAWEMGKDEGRQFVETAIWNTAGFRQIGEPGDEVAFQGEYHECPEGVSTGAAVKVVRPGWVMDEEDGGEYLILPALVSR